MADKKISALTAASTPLAGTEVLPIVQSSATVKVSVANLTAGRAISATELTLTTGNLIVASGQGVSFAATPGTGTSELLADYEEGTYTPTFTPNTSGTLALNADDLRNKFVYTKTGRSVAVTGYVQFLGSSTPIGTFVTISLPFAAYDGGGTIGGAGIVAVFNGVTYSFSLNAGASTMSWVIAASSITDGLFLTLSFVYTAT